MKNCFALALLLALAGCAPPAPPVATNAVQALVSCISSRSCQTPVIEDTLPGGARVLRTVVPRTDGLRTMYVVSEQSLLIYVTGPVNGRVEHYLIADDDLDGRVDRVSDTSAINRPQARTFVSESSEGYDEAQEVYWLSMAAANVYVIPRLTTSESRT